ncbi:4629_t:CDS:1 [Paraglomus occultum]|uniref:4629_t:CDS:1 n=1 Tax=Paraglomus occultum TaxID=144539 RepID=A0A9N9C2A4_9GLOM|nr:4629_t:CDS:1 [Paraglomus occultum]
MKSIHWSFTFLFLFLLTFTPSFSDLVDINLSAPVIIGEGTLQIQYSVYRELGYTYEITNLTIFLKPLSGTSAPYTIASTAPLYSLGNTNTTNTVSYQLPPESFGNSYNVEFVELYRTVATGMMSTAIADVRLDVPSKTVSDTKTLISSGMTIVVSTLVPPLTTVFTTVTNGQTSIYSSTVPASVMTVTLGSPTVTKATNQPGSSNGGGCVVPEGKTFVWTMISVWLGYLVAETFI